MHVLFLFSLHLFYVTTSGKGNIGMCLRTYLYPFRPNSPIPYFQGSRKKWHFHPFFFHNPFIHFLIYIFSLEPFILFFILRYGRSAIGMMETNLTEAETLISGRAATWSNKLWYRTGDKGCQESPDMTPIFDRQKNRY